MSDVINKSSTKLPAKHLSMLSKGLKFIPTLSPFNTTDIIANTEKNLQKTPSNVKKSIISEISTFMLKWKRPKHYNITKEEHNILKELKQNNEIVITQADKGGKIVIMN